MRTHPVYLCLEGRRCVVVGGDAVAEAKALACVRAGAEVTVVAATVTAAIAASADAGTLWHLARDYVDGDLRGAVIAYAVTRDAGLIARLRGEAARERVLLNVADVPDACGFLAPSVLERGALQVAVGTGGASPALAARLRRELARDIGPEYAAYVAILAAVRAALAGAPGRAAVVESLLDSPLLELVRQANHEAIDALLAGVVGRGVTLAGLGVELAA